MTFGLKWGVGEGDGTPVGKFVTSETIRMQIDLGARGSVEASVNVIPEVLHQYSRDMRLDEVLRKLFDEALAKVKEEGFQVG